MFCGRVVQTYDMLLKPAPCSIQSSLAGIVHVSGVEDSVVMWSTYMQ